MADYETIATDSSDDQIALNNPDLANEKEQFETGEPIFEESNKFIKSLDFERRPSTDLSTIDKEFHEKLKRIDSLAAVPAKEEELPDKVMFEDKLDEIEKDLADKLSKQGEKLIKEIKTKGEVLREVEPTYVLHTYLKCWLIFLTTSIIFFIGFIFKCIYMAVLSFKSVRKAIESVKYALKRLSFKRFEPDNIDTEAESSDSEPTGNTFKINF